MTKLDIIRAWKDKEYRLRMSESDRAKLPPHPSGMVELENDEIGGVAGGDDKSSTHQLGTLGCCTIIIVCGTYEIITYGCCPNLD
jgi:mersacidin/lichenicidin family type 2 lantibiotic